MLDGQFLLKTQARHTTDLNLQANMIHVAHADSGYVYTLTRTASLTWSPRQLTMPSHTGDLKQKHTNFKTITRTGILTNLLETSGECSSRVAMYELDRVALERVSVGNRASDGLLKLFVSR